MQQTTNIAMKKTTTFAINNTDQEDEDSDEETAATDEDSDEETAATDAPDSDDTDGEIQEPTTDAPDDDETYKRFKGCLICKRIG